MQLKSYVQGKWQSGGREGTLLRDATTSEVIARAPAEGIDFRSVLDHARTMGGPALQRLTFHERAACLKSLAKYLTERKEALYALSYATGATKGDSWIDIDGGINTLFLYASKGMREMPDSRVYVDGCVDVLSTTGTFVGQHIYIPLGGVAVHINAFNLPVCGMLEKLAPTLLAGMPAIVKPATATSYLTELAVRQIMESGILPEGSVQLVYGDLGDLFDHLGYQDAVAFTGSASTARHLKQHPAIIEHTVRFTGGANSPNSSILAPDAVPGTVEFDLFVQAVVQDIIVKAGQNCTAIRKALVPATVATQVMGSLREALGKVVVGNPRLEQVEMGPVVSLAQRREVIEQLGKLKREAQVFYGESDKTELAGADAERGAFIYPTLLFCEDVESAHAVHEVEAFGPVCTVLPYQDLDHAIELACRGGRSLVGSVFTADDAVASAVVSGLAPLHGRVLVVNRHCMPESMDHGSQLPHLVHEGLGSASGGDDMGGIHRVLQYMQRVAVQGSPDVLTAETGRWVKGSVQKDPGAHPFSKPFHLLVIGDTFHSSEREVTVEDIERFAALTGDCFYAHMDDVQAARNPFFSSRVAHGQFLISAAAGLFVDPPYGPVLANYGIDHLRFAKPVKPGERIKVRLTCKEKSLRRSHGYGEVRWDTEITNQADEVVATYDVLTMVSETD